MVRRDRYTDHDRLIKALRPVVALRADRGVVHTGAGVSQWRDVSGQSHHVAQSTDANRPALQPYSGPSAQACIAFDGSNDFLRGTWTWAQSMHVVAVVLPSVSNATNRTFIDGSAGNTLRLYTARSGVGSFTNGDGVLMFGGNGEIGSLATTGVEATEFSIVDARFSGASSSVRVRGGTAATGTTSSSAGGLCLGVFGDQTSNPADCKISEILGFDRILTATELLRVADYMRRRYALSM